MTLPKIIIMLGDSLTDYCSWDSLAPAAKILNQGVPGETAAGMFSRLKRAVSPGPDLIFLQTGINDLAMGRTPAETAASHRKIWQYLSDALPDAILAVCSLAPILPEKIDWHPYVLTQEGVLS
ncbi:MAG: GDSL-type esterase/lipase family protein, partial [Deltaproteobacteria bacterium]|nr:GDSL-type esterase/lipase family protein [Deltaproteobacteria bacterium]